MNAPDSDLLRKASAALREGRSGHNAGSGFTRARILNDLRRRRSKRSRWWRLGLPLGVILAGTTAWASARGNWPEVWVTMSHYLGLPLTDNAQTEAERSVAALPGRRSVVSPVTPTAGSKEVALPLATESSADPAIEHGVSPTPPPVMHVASNTPEDSSTLRRSVQTLTPPLPQSAPSPPVKTRAAQAPDSERSIPGASPPESSAAATSEVVSPPLDAEIFAFRRADDLFHKANDHAAAVFAYREYVRAYPSGRFVPEARYNTALSLIRLGRSSEARDLLEPFAEGRYGSYRREAAQRLLEALAK